MSAPLDRLPRTPQQHFTLWFYAAVAAVREGLGEARERFPFLDGYAAELDAAGADGAEQWTRTILDWEDATEDRLPLRELRVAADIVPRELVLLLAAGLPEQDARFGALFEALQGTGHARATPGLLAGWLPGWDVRGAVGRLHEQGLIEVAEASAPRLAWPLQVAPGVWDALRGELDPALASWARVRMPEELLPAERLIAPPELRDALAAAPRALADGHASTLLVRGREASGRRTLAGAVARALGRGTLELRGDARPPGADTAAADPRARGAGAIATLLHLMPVVVLDPPPGETASPPPLHAYGGPRALVLGLHGGVGGGLDGAMAIELGLPGPDERRAHWREALGAEPPERIVEQYRMTGGNVRRVAALAQAEASLAGRTRPAAADVRRAARTLHGQLLDALAERLPPAEAIGDDAEDQTNAQTGDGSAEDTHAHEAGDTRDDAPARGWNRIALEPETRAELELLERRCRARERLTQQGGAALRGQLGAGVRALLTGPSGSGKTLAARMLGARLALDVYRLNLATVVSKYLGETEKNLERTLAAAEAANALLLLDEGDALLTKRTAVQTANDRYANLETNYLLQRLESFEGILLVTTNASERIDGAFRRRMDAIVDFRAPGARERRRILALHLPDGHAVEEETLDELAVRCDLTGGQLRNVVLHAELLALDGSAPLGAQQLDDAIRREYRKAGAVCPLPEPVGARDG